MPTSDSGTHSGGISYFMFDMTAEAAIRNLINGLNFEEDQTNSNDELMWSSST
jgi:hypothetical protein